MNCCECLYWKEGQDHRIGWCHRYAPRPTIDIRKAPDVTWPCTAFDDGCGEALRRAAVTELQSFKSRV
jgi:hypothetical protein